MSRRITISLWPSSKPVARYSAGSFVSPEKKSAYILATRAGVSTSPSLPGSSPIATMIEAIASSIASLSTKRRLSKARERAENRCQSYHSAGLPINDLREG